MTYSRSDMIRAIRADVVPELRRMGFAGAYPHFRRTGPEKIDLATFQFYNSGGQFCVEIGKFPAAGFEPWPGQWLAPEKVRIIDLGQHRIRLGTSRWNRNPWFWYENREPAKVARYVVRFLKTQGAAFWADADLSEAGARRAAQRREPTGIDYAWASYVAMLFLGKGSDLRIDAVTSLLRARSGATALLTEGGRLTLSFGEWRLHVELEEGPHVVPESHELAEMLDDTGAAVRIAGCERRLSIWSPDRDPEMDHFNDYLGVVELLESSFSGVTGCEPRWAIAF